MNYLSKGKNPLLKTLIGIGENRKLDYLKLLRIHIWLQIHSYH